MQQADSERHAAESLQASVDKTLEKVRKAKSDKERDERGATQLEAGMAADRAESQRSALETQAAAEAESQSAADAARVRRRVAYIEAEAAKPPEERCAENLVGCIAAIVNGRLQGVAAWFDDAWRIPFIGRLLAAVVGLGVGVILLLMPLAAQANATAGMVFLGFPLFAALIAQDLVSQFDTSLGFISLLVAGAVAAAFAVALVWAGLPGLRLILGTWLGLAVGSLVTAAGPWSATAEAVARGLLAGLGALASQYRPNGVLAFAVCLLGGLCCASAVTFVLAALVRESTVWSWLAAAKTLFPGGPGKGLDFVSATGRVVWLLIVLPGLARVALDEGDQQASGVEKDVRQEVPEVQDEGDPERYTGASAVTPPLLVTLAPAASGDSMDLIGDLADVQWPSGVAAALLPHPHETVQLISRMARMLSKLRSALPQDILAGESFRPEKL